MLRTRLLCNFVVVVSLALAGCGGDVSVDTSDANGGAGGDDTTSTGNNNPLCVQAPEPVGDLTENGCSTIHLPEGECRKVCYDGSLNEFEVACEGNACHCKYNSKTICTCVLNQQVDICGDGVNACCPVPWLGF